MKKIVVGTTLAAMAMSNEDTWSAWLKHAERQSMMALDQGYALRHFAAIQVDARGLAPFTPLLDELSIMGAHWWTYSLDDGRTKVDMTNRWRHIVFGQNLVRDYCQADPDVEWLLFLAADCAAPSNIVPAMLEMGHSIVAPFISTYNLRGPKVEGYPFHVEDAMASMAAIMIHRGIFRQVPFRWDLDAGRSDDPCFWYDTREILGVPTYVRHDVLARHYPESIGDYEQRGLDTTVVR